MALGLGALLCRVLTTVTTYLLPAYLNFKELVRHERASPEKTTATVMLFDRKYSLTRSAEKKDDDADDTGGGEKRVTSLEGWMIYWIVVGFWTCIERVLDMSVFWLPLYNEFKVAFCIYLWHPNTRGAEFLYFSLVKPYLIMNEAVIDAYICDIKAFVYDSILSMLDRSKTVRLHTCAYARACPS